MFILDEVNCGCGESFLPSLRPSCFPGRFCQRRVELAPPPYSHAQTDVCSERGQVNNKLMDEVITVFHFSDSTVERLGCVEAHQVRWGHSQIPVASRNSQCAAGHGGHLGNATKKNTNWSTRKILNKILLVLEIEISNYKHQKYLSLSKWAVNVYICCETCWSICCWHWNKVLSHSMSLSKLCWTVCAECVCVLVFTYSLPLSLQLLCVSCQLTNHLWVQVFSQFFSLNREFIQLTKSRSKGQTPCVPVITNETAGEPVQPMRHQMYLYQPIRHHVYL